MKMRTRGNRWARAQATLTVSCIAALAACVHTGPAEEPPPVEVAEDSFRLFPDADTGGIPSAVPRPASSPAPALFGEGSAKAEDRLLPDSYYARNVAERIEDTAVPGFVIREEESLRAVVDELRQLTGLPLVVLPAAEAAVFDAGIVFDFQLENELSAAQLLNLIAGTTDGAVGWTIKHDAILFTTDPLRGQKLVVHAHDINDLVMPRTDFKGPRIDRIRLVDEQEDEDGGGAFGGSESVTVMTGDEVATLVRETVVPEGWELPGVRIEAENGRLVVVHTVEVQLAVQAFLDSIR